MLLDLCLLEALVLERLLVESSLRLVLIEGVLSLAIALTRVVVTRASLLPALLGAASDEVVGVTTVEASILAPTMLSVLALLWNHMNQLATSARYSYLRLSIYSFMIDNKDDRINKAGEGLEAEPPLETRATVDALGFSILSRFGGESWLT
jgi:hypothetical protein